MGRTSGTYTLTSNIEPKVGAPLDARTIVKLLADLTANNTFEYPYKGMMVFVEENTKTYTLIGTDPTVSANWVESGASQIQTDWNQSDNTKVDYIKNKPENLVQDANYVHTDNNYDASAKNAVDSLGTASTKDIPTSGNASTTEVVMGNDTRLTDARTPVSHNHTVSDITDFPTLGTAAAKDVPSSGNASTTQVVMGNDTRLTDARTPVSHTHTTSDISGLGTAATTNTTNNITQGGTDIPTAGAVWSAIDNLPEPMILKGTLGTGGTITSLPTAAADNEGHTYKVITNGTYAGQAAKVGDFFVSCKPVGASASEWIWFPSGDESVTDTWRNIKVNGTEKLGTGISSGAIDFVNGTNTTVEFDASGNKLKINSSYTNTDRYVNSAAFADDSSNNANSPVKMTLTRAGSDTVQVTANVPKVSSSSAGVAPKGTAVSSQSQSTKFLREDGTWSAPSYTTDTKVTQTNIANSNTGVRRVILSGSDNDTDETKLVYKNTQLTFVPSTGTLTSPKVNQKILQLAKTGTGTAAEDKGSSANPRYFPSRWVFNFGYAPSDGDIITITIPVASHSWGNWLSIDNGANYYPVNVSYGTSRMTTHFGVNNIIQLVFDADGQTNSMTPVTGANSVNGTNVTNGCWRVINFYDTNSNNYDRNLYNVAIKCGSTAIVAGNIIVGKDGVFHHLKDGTAFDINYPILYANGAIAANATSTNNYDVLMIAIATTQSMTLTAYLPLFIKGTLSGNIFTPVSTTPLTQTVPTTADGYYYMLLGVAYSTTNIYLDVDHRIFAYKNGKFGEVVNDALSVNGYTVAKSVPSDAVFTDNNTTYTVATGDANGQIKVTPSSGSAYNVGVKGLGNAAYVNRGTGVLEVNQSASRSTATTGGWTSMCNSGQTGSPKLPVAGLWWNVISLDNWASAPTNWMSQLALPTQAVQGDATDTVWFKHNDASGTNIDSSTWHSLVSGNIVGAARYGTTSSTTKIKININSETSWMLSFVVTLYQGYRATKVMISGYNYSSNHWHQPVAKLLADSTNATINVYFGYDANWKLWVGFDGGSYTGVSVSDVCNGYTQITDYNNLFTITNVSSLATIQTTTTATKPDAATVNGLSFSLVT